MVNLKLQILDIQIEKITHQVMDQVMDQVVNQIMDQLITVLLIKILNGKQTNVIISMLIEHRIIKRKKEKNALTG